MHLHHSSSRNSLSFRECSTPFAALASPSRSYLFLRSVKALCPSENGTLYQAQRAMQHSTTTSTDKTLFPRYEKLHVVLNNYLLALMNTLLTIACQNEVRVLHR